MNPIQYIQIWIAYHPALAPFWRRYARARNRLRGPIGECQECGQEFYSGDLLRVYDYDHGGIYACAPCAADVKRRNDETYDWEAKK